jgi:hypothetical protein
MSFHFEPENLRLDLFSTMALQFQRAESLQGAPTAPDEVSP